MAWSKPRQKNLKILRIIEDPRNVMAIKGKGKRNNSPRGFYGRALDEAEKIELEEASHVEGIDEEIALLRVKLRELLEEQPERIDLHFEAANIIARLVRTRYQITKEQKKSLKEAIQKVLTEVAVPLGVGIGIKAVSK
jgi:hypothetical protein